MGSRYPCSAKSETPSPPGDNHASASSSGVGTQSRKDTKDMNPEQAKWDPSFLRPADPQQESLSMPRTAFQDLPNYWECPEVPCAPITEQSIPVRCQYAGGIHISWVHYCLLCFTIFCMAIAVTLWTAVALHRSDTVFALPDFRSPVQMQSTSMTDKLPAPEINFSPHIVCGAPVPDDGCLKVLVTRKIPVTVVETVTALPFLASESCPCPELATITVTTSLSASTATVYSTVAEQVSVLPSAFTTTVSILSVYTTTAITTVSKEVTVVPPTTTTTTDNLIATLTLSMVTSLPTTIIETTTLESQPPPMTRYFHNPS